MHRSRIFYALGLSLVLALSGCSTIKIVNDRDPEADFTQFRTWAWISADNLIGPRAGELAVSYVSPIDEQRIRRAVRAELGAKGYQQADAATADLIVSFTIGTEEKTEIYSTPSPRYSDAYGYGYGYGGWYGGSEVRTRRYTEGTLSLQFFDRASKNAVWVGWASKRVSKNDDSEQIIAKAIAKVLQRFPARP